MMFLISPVVIFTMENEGQKFFENLYIAAYIAYERCPHVDFSDYSKKARDITQQEKFHRDEKDMWAAELIRIYPGTYRINLFQKLEKDIPTIGDRGNRQPPFSQVIVLEDTASKCGCFGR